MRPFRFGYQLGDEPVEEVIAGARAAEAAGFDVLHTSDHIGGKWAPLTTLTAIGAATNRVRLCPLVVNNDFWNPVLLAREVVALDHLTDGRVELGLGAGHSFPEYEAMGMVFDPPKVRKARLAESVEILRRLFDGGQVTFVGEHYQLRDVQIAPTRQARLPIFVGVNGPAALAHAARHADMIGLTMVGRTLEDGQRHEVRWEADRLDRTVAYVAAQAESAGRTEPPELHALVQSVIITDDREAVAAKLVHRGQIPSAQIALTTPFLAIGTHAEIADHLRACRDRWGISYFSVRTVESFAPVIAHLSAELGATQQFRPAFDDL